MTHRRLAAPALAIFAIVLASPAVAACGQSVAVGRRTVVRFAVSRSCIADDVRGSEPFARRFLRQRDRRWARHRVRQRVRRERAGRYQRVVRIAAEGRRIGREVGLRHRNSWLCQAAQPTVVSADGAGTFSHVVVLSQAGMATITATGTVSQRSSSSTVNVLSHAVAVGAAQSPSAPHKRLLTTRR